MRYAVFLIIVLIYSCKHDNRSETAIISENSFAKIDYAKGFTIEELEDGIKMLHVSSPWPDAGTKFKYALVPREINNPNLITEVDAVIKIPVERLVVTSTTHIPALEVLGMADRLIGFPETKYVSSIQTRKLIDSGKVQELGSNEALNTEMTIAVNPDLVVGFGIDDQNKAYSAIESAGIPVVYNGDWTEETPLGKAEWIKFFAVFFNVEKKADSIFHNIEKEYHSSRKLAKSARKRPDVLSGALYKDIWYLPAGESWAARFIEDANANYLWGKSEGTGSLSLSLETVLDRGSEADVWISPSQYVSYEEMLKANEHYLRFKPFRAKRLFTFAKSRGATGGLLYYEMAPSRPDLVLKDLIHIFHPDLMPDYEPYFFKPLN